MTVQEKQQALRKNSTTESENDDDFYRFLDKGHSPVLDDPNNGNTERVVPTKPIENLIDDVSNIDLVNLSLTEEQTESFVKVLNAKKEKIQLLSLRNCQIHGGNMTALKEVMEEMTNLVELNLNDNGMDSEQCTYLGEVIAKGRTKIRTLILQENEFGNVGLGIILDSLKHTNNLRALDVSRCAISDDGAEMLLDFLTNKNCLAELTLSGNEFTKEGWLCISSALKSDHGLLQTLSIDNNNIGDDELAIICQGLAQNKTLQHLDIEGNRFTNKGGEHLLEALQRCKTIVDVTLQPGQLSTSVESCIRELINEHV